MPEEGITRRDFVRQAAGTAAGAALVKLLPGEAPAADAAKPDPAKALNYNPKMRYRPFGHTGVMLSELGLGGHWKTPTGGRYWERFPKDIPPPDVQKNRDEVVAKCAELGVNYLDVTTRGEAAVYGRAMKRTGAKLHVGYSDHILCIRDPKNRTVEKMTFEIDEGLRRLQVDRIWLWRPQALMNGGHTVAEMDRVVEAYDRAKKQGKVLYLGMSTHSHKFARWVLEKWGDRFHGFVFMYTVSSERKPSDSLFDAVRARRAGAIALKPFHGNAYFRVQLGRARRAGRKPDLNAAAVAGLRKILDVPELTCVIPGMTTAAEVSANAKCSSPGAGKLPRAQREAVAALARASLEQLPAEYAWIRDQGTFV